MGDFGLMRIGVRKDEKGFDVIQTKLAEVPVACKECKKEPRAQGLSRCLKCKEANKLVLFDRERLQRKVEEQAKLIA